MSTPFSDALLAGQDFAPGVRGNEGADQLRAAERRNLAAPVFDFVARDGVNEVTFAQGQPVHPVGVIQNDLGVAGLPVRGFG